MGYTPTKGLAYLSDIDNNGDQGTVAVGWAENGSETRSSNWAQGSEKQQAPASSYEGRQSVAGGESGHDAKGE